MTYGEITTLLNRYDEWKDSSTISGLDQTDPEIKELIQLFHLDGLIIQD